MEFVLLELILLFIFTYEVSGENTTEVCPIWMSYDSVHQCQCTNMHYTDRYTCVGNDSIHLGEAYCVSFDDSRQFLIAGLCPYSYYQKNYTKNLNSSVTSPETFNKVMCGPLNREGLLCSKCIPGHGIPVFSKVEDKCVKCGSKWAWPLYLSLTLLPVTLFYILVIIFNFSATHPPITAYIFYCQLFTQIVLNVRYVRHRFETHTNRAFLYATWTICDIWNLDVLRYVIPSFCLSEHLSNTDALFLELITALYPLFLILLTVIFIQLHANNFRVVVYVWKPFHSCFSSLRRTWDPKSSVVNAFTTFLLFSSFKISLLILTIFNKYKPLGNGTLFHITVLYIDPNIKYTDLHKQAYFIPSLLLIMFFIAVPILCLCLYPTKLCKILTQCICSGRQRNLIFLFMESFQGHYKNGTSGTYDYRSASSIGFLLRLLTGVSLSRTWSGIPSTKSGSISLIALMLLLVSLFFAHVRPCKKQYMNVIESLLYFMAALLLIFVVHNNHFPQLFHLILVVILMPSVIYMCIIMYKVFDVLGIVEKVVAMKIFKWKIASNNDIEPHRLTHPTQYTPLLQ